MIVVVAVEEPAVIVLDDVAEPRGAGSRQVRIERLDPVAGGVELGDLLPEHRDQVRVSCVDRSVVS